MISTLLSLAGSAVSGFFSHLEGEKEITITKAELAMEKQKLLTAFEIKLLEERRKPESEFRAFALEYEGRAKDLPLFVQILRASVRPVLTYGVFALLSCIMLGVVEGESIRANMGAIPSEFWFLINAVVIFWFGEKAVTRGIRTHKDGEVKKIRENNMIRTVEAQTKIDIERAKSKKDDGGFLW